MPLRLASHLGCSCSVRRGPAARHCCFIIVSSDIGIVARYVRPPRSPRARQFREFRRLPSADSNGGGLFLVAITDAQKRISVPAVATVQSTPRGTPKAAASRSTPLPCFIRRSAATGGRCAPQRWPGFREAAAQPPWRTSLLLWKSKRDQRAGSEGRPHRARRDGRRQSDHPARNA